MPDISLFTIEYLYLAIILFAVMVVYFRLAVRWGIIDKPNERSSHVRPTIRGGGIIFPLTILLFLLLDSAQYPLFATAVLLTGLISFIDDIRNMPRSIRFGVHVVAAALILYEAGAMQLSVVMIALAFLFVVGMINAFNFMDGINGIYGLL